MATTKTNQKRSPNPKDGGGGGTVGDSPILIGGGGGSKRVRRLYLNLDFNHDHFRRVPGRKEFRSQNDVLRLLRIKGRAKNVRDSTWLKIFCQNEDGSESEIKIFLDPIGLEFECEPNDDFPPSGPIRHHGDDWYITGVYANGAGTLYQYPGFGSTDCDIEINPLAVKQASKRKRSVSTSVTKRGAAKKR
jgi:hypothetical protein